MKKIVVGCGLVVVLLAIAGGVGAYYFVYKPARTFVTSMTQLGEVAKLDATVANRAAFTPPAAGTLSAAQVERFVAVQERIHKRLGARASELEAKYKAMANEERQIRSVGEVVGAYRDVFGLIADAKRAQVDALNSQQFSLAEYAWVKARFYEAAGVAMTGIDFREIAGKMSDGDFGAFQEMATTNSVPATDTPGAGIPEGNRVLVTPYEEPMKAWFVYGMFGL